MRSVSHLVRRSQKLRKESHNMPLPKGKKNIGKNIKTEMAHGKSRAQSIAIALSVAKQSKKKKK